jgi:hypothetical protein
MSYTDRAYDKAQERVTNPVEKVLKDRSKRMSTETHPTGGIY